MAAKIIRLPGGDVGMTPERKKWWDNLPKVEKNTRTALNREKEVIKHNKNDLANEKGYVAKKIILATIKHEKAVIKALYKQIGMNAVNELRDGGKADGLGDCPSCGCVVASWNDYCPDCGQKLRWK